MQVNLVIYTEEEGLNILALVFFCDDMKTSPNAVLDIFARKSRLSNFGLS